MPDLDFAVEGAEVVTFAVTPTLALKLRITDSGEEPVHAVMLDCQVRIEAPRRRYVPAERERLGDLFGDPSRWSQTLRSLLWTHASVNVPPFTSSVLVDLRLPCTYDFNVQVTKYFDSLEDGEVPLTLLFSGSVFFAGPGGALQVERVSWSKEAGYRLPVRVWRDVIDHYYPNTAWLNLHKDVFDRLAAYKARRGLPTWEQALEALLLNAEELKAR
jgi:Family of unknown function (DUF6084)